MQLQHLLATATAALLAGQSAAKTIAINAGTGGKFVFSPDSVTAAVGDVLEFSFAPINHSVAQGDFSSPCRPPTSGGFFSGYMPSSSGNAPNVFRVTVNDTNPLFFYCTQPTLRHCSAGMVGVVNPSGSQTVDAFRAAAMAFSGGPVAPPTVFGGSVAAAGSGSGSSSSASASGSSASATGASASASASATPASGGGNGYGGTVPGGAGTLDVKGGLVLAVGAVLGTGALFVYGML